MKCEGCKDFEACTFLTVGSVAINECPCSICLLKMLCEEPCDKLTDHYNNTYNALNKECEDVITNKANLHDP